MLDQKAINEEIEKLKQQIADSTVNVANYTFDKLLPIIERLQKENAILVLEKTELQKKLLKSEKQNRDLADQLTLSRRPRVN